LVFVVVVWVFDRVGVVEGLLLLVDDEMVLEESSCCMAEAVMTTYEY
jgi:hypothetical protein